MKLRVTMKDPDAILDAKADLRHELVNQLVNDLNISRTAAEVEVSERFSKLDHLVSQYFEWGEYVTIELDTDAGTATLVRRE